jgi:hypothetical protein
MGWMFYILRLASTFRVSSNTIALLRNFPFQNSRNLPHLQSRIIALMGAARDSLGTDQDFLRPSTSQASTQPHFCHVTCDRTFRPAVITHIISVRVVITELDNQL